MIDEGNGVTARNIPQELSDALAKAVAERQPIRSVFLTRGGGWGMIYGRNGYSTRLPSDMADLDQAIRLANQQNQEIRVVTVTPDSNGWAMLLDDRQIICQRCPGPFVEFFTGSAMYRRVECLALGPADWYCMTFDSSGYSARTAQTFLPKLEELNKKAEHLRFLWMAPGQEGVVYGDNGFHISSLAADLKKHLLDLNSRNTRIELVAVRMDGSGSAQLSLASSLAAPPVAANPQPASPAAAQGPTLVTAPESTTGPAGARFHFPSQPVLGGVAPEPKSYQPPAPNNPNQRLISQAYTLVTKQTDFSRPVSVTLAFDRNRLSTAADAGAIYAVCGRGGILEKLPCTVDKTNAVVKFQTTYNRARVHGEGEAQPDPAYFAVAQDKSQLETVLDQPDFRIWTVPGQKDKAVAANGIYKDLKKIKSDYAAQGFSLPEPLDVYLMPLNGVRGHAGPTSLHFDIRIGLQKGRDNSYFWSSDEGCCGTLAHELFHVVQENGGRAYEVGAFTGEDNWAAESTAQLMAWKLYPNSPVLRGWIASLGPEYAFDDLFTYMPEPEEGWKAAAPAHQYQSLVFWAFLNKHYDATAIVAKMYRGSDQRASTMHAFLEQTIASTPDRAGRRRAFADVYMDFLVSFLWKKDFEPLASCLDTGKLGKSGTIRMPKAGAGRHQGWNIPYEDGGKRTYSKTFRNQVGNFNVVRAYNVSSMTRTTPVAETGALKVNLQGIPSMRLLVFPYSSSQLAPVMGRPGQTLEIPNWEKLGGALVLAVHAADGEHQPFSLEVGMKEAKEPEPAAPSERVGLYFLTASIKEGTSFVRGTAFDREGLIVFRHGGGVGNYVCYFKGPFGEGDLNFLDGSTWKGTKQSGTLQGTVQINSRDPAIGNNLVRGFTGRYDPGQVIVDIQGLQSLIFYR